MPALPIDTNQIVITASRAPDTQAQTPASVTIIDAQRIDRLDEPLLPALLRLTPSISVSASGPAGSFTEVRLRGAEVNHTLLFIDGIRVNDPASGDFPRFELLNADLASRIEVVRGPQSALWGSEAIGGVIALNGTADAPGYRAAVEGGSFGFLRASVSGAVADEQSSILGGMGWQRATGIDSFNGLGDKDGYRNLSARLRGTWKPMRSTELGASALALSGRTEFDGFDPLTFAHTDTLDSSRNRLRAGRLWAKFGGDSSPWTAQIDGALLASSNRNFLADEATNLTRGTRRNLGAQIERRFVTGAVSHRLIAAAELERETFRARGTISGVQRRRCSPARLVQSIPGHDESSRVPSRQNRRRLLRRRLLRRRDRSADFLRPLWVLSQRLHREPGAQAGKLARLRRIASLPARSGCGIDHRLSSATARRNPHGLPAADLPRDGDQSRQHEPQAGHRGRGRVENFGAAARRSELRPPGRNGAASRRQGPRTQATETLRLGHGRRRFGPAELRRLARVRRPAFRQPRCLPVRPGRARVLLARRSARGLRGPPGGRGFRPRVEPVRPELSGRVRLPYRGARPLRRDQAGGSAIIAVNSHSVAISPSSIARPANLQTRARFCRNSTSRRRSTPGSTGFLNFTPSMDMK
jgi:TonB-dependent receptor-like protein